MHLITPKLLAQHRSAALIDRMYLEHALCQIDANHRWGLVNCGAVA
jgi:hypothetical protein